MAVMKEIVFPFMKADSFINPLIVTISIGKCYETRLLGNHSRALDTEY